MAHTSPCYSHSLSIIVPVYRDNPALIALLNALQSQSHHATEILVCDGESSAECQKICQQFQAQWLPCEPGRGKQLDYAARKASGDIVWFVHADSQLASDSIQQIHRAIETGQNGGWFRFAFDGAKGFLPRTIEVMTNWRCHRGIPYGDQGLFALHDEYLKTDGFEHVPLFEEVRFVRRMRQQGRFQAVPQHIGVDPRRWHRDGWWKRIILNRTFATLYMLGVSPNKLACWYRSWKTQ